MVRLIAAISFLVIGGHTTQLGAYSSRIPFEESFISVERNVGVISYGTQEVLELADDQKAHLSELISSYIPSDDTLAKIRAYVPSKEHMNHLKLFSHLYVLVLHSIKLELANKENNTWGLETPVISRTKKFPWAINNGEQQEYYQFLDECRKQVGGSQRQALFQAATKCALSPKDFFLKYYQKDLSFAKSPTVSAAIFDRFRDQLLYKNKDASFRADMNIASTRVDVDRQHISENGAKYTVVNYTCHATPVIDQEVREIASSMQQQCSDLKNLLTEDAVHAWLDKIILSFDIQP